MATEIEYKYLVKTEAWKKIVPEKSIEIKQAYLLTDPDKTIRVRTKGDKGYFTIKGRTIGASRLEFEYEIPIADAKALIQNFSSHLIEKTRHIVKHEGKTWEVDEFKGLNNGLFIAEIEVNSEQEAYAIPNWAGKNVTDDPKYANANLTISPFSTW